MYLTAHLVRDRDGIEGINAFLHLHGAQFLWPEDASALPDERPGKIVGRAIHLPPGGNSVRAYVDILAPDGTQRDEIANVVAELQRDLPERLNPTTFVRGNVTIRFGVELGLEGLKAQQLEMLVAATTHLLDEYLHDL